MSEEQTQETTQEKNQESTQESFTADELKAEKDKIRNSMSQQLSEMQKKLQAFESQKEQEEKQKLIEQEDFKTLIEKLEGQIKAKDGDLENYKKEIQNQKIDSALYQAGIKDKYARVGVMSEYNGLEEKPEIDAFVSGLRESHSTLFFNEQAHKGKSSGAVGLPVQNGTGQPLEERLKSKDPEVKMLALREQLENRLSGK